MKSLIASILFFITCIFSAASAQQNNQDVVWVQIEAHSSLRVAQNRAQAYAGTLADVNGFSLGGNWYGVVLGPYLRADAQQVLNTYRAQGQIPQDSFISFTRSLGQQFWPVGADVLSQGAVTVPQVDQGDTVIAVLSDPEPSDETPAEARRSERTLTGDERKGLQIALRAAGFYNSSIDGAFGPGTRRSMRDWQISNGFEDSGILTTAQRKVLMDQYNAPLISVGMRLEQNTKAGISMQIPAGAVKFARFEPPFAHYDATTDLGARVLLISQPGNTATLHGLYDIMQTLEIVPLEGPRERSKDRFTLEGSNRDIVSYTQARLIDGEIKGFTLIWPVGDEDRRQRVLSEMKASFSRFEGVLDPAAGADTEQRIDLVSGLEVRKPRLSRSGFYIDTKGTVVTTAEAVNACTRITLDEDHQADLVSTDNTVGIAILRPATALAPMSVAQFSAVAPRLQSDVTVSGYSYEGVLGAPTLTYGTVADVKGLRGETDLDRLVLAALPGDAGGPVFDTAGSVLGMLLPAPDDGQKLPGDVSFTADAAAIRNALDLAGLSVESSVQTSAISPDALTRMATGMTVLVSCWD